MEKGAWPSQKEAEQLLDEYTDSQNLKKHAFAVEAGMRSYAEKFKKDPEKWGVAGLLHDLDYEKYPEEHPERSADIFKQKGYGRELTETVLSHCDSTGVERDTMMKKALFAVDELTGLIVAVALVRPSKSLADVSVESVLKKWNRDAFASGVDRGMIEKGAEDLGVPLKDHISNVIDAMKGISKKLGL